MHNDLSGKKKRSGRRSHDQAQLRVFEFEATLARSSDNMKKPMETAASRVSEPLSPFWLWLTLIFSASCLWLERKLDFAFNA